MTDAARARILLGQCERLSEDLVARGWRLVPQIEDIGTVSMLVHAFGQRTTLVTLPASGWTSTVVGLRGGPEKGSLLRAPVEQWRYFVPMPRALCSRRAAPTIRPTGARCATGWSGRRLIRPRELSGGLRHCGSGSFLPCCRGRGVSTSRRRSR